MRAGVMFLERMGIWLYPVIWGVSLYMARRCLKGKNPDLAFLAAAVPYVLLFFMLLAD